MKQYIPFDQTLYIQAKHLSQTRESKTNNKQAKLYI